MASNLAGVAAPNHDRMADSDDRQLRSSDAGYCGIVASSAQAVMLYWSTMPLNLATDIVIREDSRLPQQSGITPITEAEIRSLDSD